MGIGQLLKRVIDSNERELARLRKIVELINSYEPKMQAFPDAALRAKTDEFRERLKAGETLQDILPEAFALVREAARRTIHMRHFDVQLMGGIVLHEGKIAEMKTGEGKTLVATLPLYLNALEGHGCHLVTVNDYLAKRDRFWMGPVYEFLGLTVGYIQHDMEPPERRAAYLSDITYCTNNEVGFDYLRDNRAEARDWLVLRELNYAIIDEVDSILIDEARTPLIISGMAEESTQLYYKIDKVAAQLNPATDYTIDEKAKTAMLTEEGTHRIENMLGLKNLSDIENMEFATHVNQALRARTVYKKDIDYVVKDGEVIIVDEFTGRLMFGRRYSEGLHQAIEAKEAVRIQHESQTLATITFQNLFRLYKKLAGMTGTAKTEEEEFIKIYSLPVVVIPTNEPMIREDHPDIVYKTEDAKFRGIVSEILTIYAKQEPVLVGTRSIEISERLSNRLAPDKLRLLGLLCILQDKLQTDNTLNSDEKKKFNQLINTKFEELTYAILAPLARRLGMDTNMLILQNISHLANILGLNPTWQDKLKEALLHGIPHNVLNAKYHEKEAQIIAEAGRKGTVTIATNMAGRGVDIVLGGKPEDPAIIESPYHDEVVELGGLHIIGTERHEARRIDNQLRGRSGRQGDPGSSRFYLSFEDELMRLFGHKPDSIWFRVWPDQQPLEGRLVTKIIENAQKRVESHNFSIRNDLLKYDEVMNFQRETIYTDRRKILQGVDMKANVLNMLEDIIRAEIDHYASQEIHPADWDLLGLYQALYEIFPINFYLAPEDLQNRKRDELKELILNKAKEAYEEKEKMITPETMRELERFILLRVIDSKWIGHLDAMDYLKEGINLRAYAQQDPIIPYRRETFDMFEGLLARIKEDVVKYMFRIQVAPQTYRSPYRVTRVKEPAAVATPTNRRNAKTKKRKIGRNDPCPCGSGKKFKRCHWGQDISQFLR